MSSVGAFSADRQKILYKAGPKEQDYCPDLRHPSPKVRWIKARGSLRSNIWAGLARNILTTGKVRRTPLKKAHMGSLRVVLKCCKGDGGGELHQGPWPRTRFRAAKGFSPKLQRVKSTPWPCSTATTALQLQARCRHLRQVTVRLRDCFVACKEQEGHRQGLSETVLRLRIGANEWRQSDRTSRLTAYPGIKGAMWWPDSSNFDCRSRESETIELESESSASAPTSSNIEDRCRSPKSHVVLCFLSLLLTAPVD